MNNLQISYLDHVALEVNNLDEAVQFYTHIIGLALLDTPDSVKSNGVQWLELNQTQALHLVENKAAEPGKISHVALNVSDVEEWKNHFEEAGVPIQPPKFQMYKAHRFFILDPSGNRIEFLKWSD